MPCTARTSHMPIPAPSGVPLGLGLRSKWASLQPVRHVVPRSSIKIRAAGKEGDKPDISSAWKKFKKSAGLQDASSFVSSNPSPPPQPTEPQRTAQKQIRQQERVLLDVWSTSGFMKAGAGVAVVMMFVFIFIIGPPPSDGLCTLPWC